MNSSVDMSLVKDGLVIPSEYLESGNLPDMQAAIEKGLVLESVYYTYIADAPGVEPTPGWNHNLLPGERDSYLHKDLTVEATIQVPDQHYYTLQAYYLKAFEVYLLKTLRLDLIEKEIASSDLDFREVEYERMSRLQRLSNLDLKYLYICIPMRIENLSQEDADKLKYLYAENGSEITEEALEFVVRTYPEVIKYETFTGGYPLQTGYGISWHPESLVISFPVPYPSEYTEHEDWTEERKLLGIAREEFILENLPLYWERMQPLLNVPLTLVAERDGAFYLYTINEGPKDEEAS